MTYRLSMYHDRKMLLRILSTYILIFYTHHLLEFFKMILNRFEGFNKSEKAIPCSSKKLIDLGFQFAYKDYSAGDLCAEAIESCREKGLLWIKLQGVKCAHIIKLGRLLKRTCDDGTFGSYNCTSSVYLMNKFILY